MAGNSFFGSSGLLNSCDKLKVGDTVIVGACVTWFTGAGKGSLLEISNFLKNHHAPTKAVTPTPEKSHSLFLTSQFHIRGHFTLPIARGHGTKAIATEHIVRGGGARAGESKGGDPTAISLRVPDLWEVGMGTRVIPGAEQLWARLDALYDAKQLELIPSYIQPELFHYTTVEGLKGIVESNTLWATSAYHLNDSSEIEYGCQLVAETVGEWLKANAQQPNTHTLPLLVLDLLKASFVDPFSRIARHVGIYVSCFCESGNLLSQWRAYGQTGGYSIGMLASELELRISAPGFFATRLLKVNYSRKQQRERIHSVLRDFIEVVEDQTLYTFPTERPAMNKFLSELAIYLQELVMDEIVAFKNPAFEEEREWRIVARPRLIEMKRIRDEPQRANENQDHGETGTNIQYRHSKGVLVPYLKLSPLDNGQLPIHSLRFGPSLDKFQTEYALQGFLLKHGYEDIQVFGSEMPVIL